MSAAAKETSTKVFLGPGRASFPHVFKPQKNDQGEDRYSIAVLLPPTFDIAPLVAALEAAAIKKFGADKSKWPKKMRRPEDVIGDCADKDTYANMPPGWRYVNATSKDQPGVVDAHVKDVLDAKELYPGRWLRVSANAYGYDNKGNKGVTFGLNNIQLLKHDETLAGKPRADREFDEMAAEMEDAKDDAEDWN